MLFPSSPPPSEKPDTQAKPLLTKALILPGKGVTSNSSGAESAIKKTTKNKNFRIDYVTVGFRVNSSTILQDCRCVKACCLFCLRSLRRFRKKRRANP